MIELIAVMVVVAVLAATAVPTLGGLGDKRSAVAARHLRRDLTFARQYALATGTRSWVAFDLAAQTWSLLVEDPLSPGRVGATAMVDAGTGQPYVTRLNSGSFAGAQVNSADFDGDVEVGFDWLGAPLSGAEAALAADGTVALTGGFSVTVVAATGHVALAAP